jgi:hypothetical protein
VLLDSDVASPGRVVSGRVVVRRTGAREPSASGWSLEAVGKAVLDPQRVDAEAVLRGQDAQPSSRGFVMMRTEPRVSEFAPPCTVQRFSLALPAQLPPSYSGNAAKFVYAVVLAPMRSGQRLREELQVPFCVELEERALQERVELRCGLQAALQVATLAGAEAEEALSLKARGGSVLELPNVEEKAGAAALPGSPAAAAEDDTAAEALNALPISYNVTLTRGDGRSEHIVRLTLTKRKYRMGDTVRGLLDFAGASLRCYRVAVAFECVETLDEQTHAADLAYARAPSSSSGWLWSPKIPLESRKILWQSHEYCAQVENTSFEFSLPHRGTASFRTNVVSVQHRLRFKFIVDSAAAAAARAERLARARKAPQAPPAEPAVEELAAGADGGSGGGGGGGLSSVSDVAEELEAAHLPADPREVEGVDWELGLQLLPVRVGMHGELEVSGWEAAGQAHAGRELCRTLQLA